MSANGVSGRMQNGALDLIRSAGLIGIHNASGYQRLITIGYQHGTNMTPTDTLVFDLNPIRGRYIVILAEFTANASEVFTISWNGGADSANLTTSGGGTLLQRWTLDMTDAGPPSVSRQGIVDQFTLTSSVTNSAECKDIYVYESDTKDIELFGSFEEKTFT